MRDTYQSALRTLYCCAVTLLAAAVFTSPAAAQYEVTWYTIDNGGTTNASGGGYAAGGATGQHDAGAMIGNGYAVTGGFWVFSPADVPTSPPALPSDAEHQVLKNRYISLDLAPNETAMVAYEVTLAEMNRCSGDPGRACLPSAPSGNADACPNVCSGNYDIQCANDAHCGAFAPCIPSGPCVAHPDAGKVVGFIDEPYLQTEPGTCNPNSSNGMLGDCVGHYFANVVCTPVYRVWTEELVHVTACEVVPAAVYDVRAVDSSSQEKSDPLTIGTVGKPSGVHYADMAGPVAGGAFGPPDGYVSVIDVSAFLITNQGGVGSTAPAHTTWVDLQGTEHGEECPGVALCVIPQAILSISDLSMVKFGFIGRAYTATPGQEDPCNCPRQWPVTSIGGVPACP